MKLNKKISENILYIVATPIGNIEDITVRAINILKQASLVAAEDTRRTSALFSHYNITTPLISYYEQNEDKRSDILIRKLKNGASVALVSDAGTPLISDPGYRLVKKAVRNNIKIVPIPGVSAITASLSAAALPTDSFFFKGFMPKKKQKRIEVIKELKEYKATLIFYESPMRIKNFIKELLEIIGDRDAVLAREITKTYEEFIRGNLSDILNNLNVRDSVKGECTLLVAGKTEENLTDDLFLKELEHLLLKDNKRLSEAVKDITDKYKISKKIVYDKAVKIKKELDTTLEDKQING
ncbi:MAG: 16S rRNA (cytidine(1402)-2'-O)-methyltransferase [Deltaproteobacteria bacterium]|nr:16S rRNA (cytidine(1402)-2'-O)-methyltransferase [Deltaproteobacteria bacterium]